MNQDNLEFLANFQSHGISKNINERYGIGRELVKSCSLPKWFPLFVSVEHGILFWDKPPSEDLNDRYNIRFLFSLRTKELWDNYSNKNSYVVKNPFYLYRKRHNLVKSENSKGSIFFLGHSTPGIDVRNDFDCIIQKLNTLLGDFHPVKVALHFADINRGYHIPFIRAGFNCETAGHYFNNNFIKNFYDMLSGVKYAIGNTIGSHTFYAIDFGLPYSRFDCQSVMFNQFNRELPIGEWFLSSKLLQEVESIFPEGISKRITDEQRKITERELGIFTGISSRKLRLLITREYIRSLCPKRFKNFAIQLIKKMTGYWFSI